MPERSTRRNTSDWLSLAYERWRNYLDTKSAHSLLLGFLSYKTDDVCVKILSMEATCSAYSLLGTKLPKVLNYISNKFTITLSLKKYCSLVKPRFLTLKGKKQNCFYCMSTNTYELQYTSELHIRT